MKITFYGHSCFMAHVNGKNLLFDPFITPNELAKDINIEDLKVDYVILSHGHQDHVADVEAILKHNPEALLVANFEIIEWYGGKGFENGHPLNHGGKVQLDGFSLKYVNAIHSSVLPDGTYGGNPGGYVLESEEANFYFAGDTALTYDMKLIGEFHKIDFSLMPIGDNFTMGVEDAIRACDFVNCGEVIGLHYDTFPPIKINGEDAIKKFKSHGKNLHLPKIGATVNLD